MPRRPSRPTKAQIERELAAVIRAMEAVSSRYDLSNGELRFRIKLLESDLRDLLRRLTRT